MFVVSVRRCPLFQFNDPNPYTLELFRKKVIPTETVHHILPTYGQERGATTTYCRIASLTLIPAVEESWMREFSGDASHALWKNIKIYHTSRLYAHYTAIVQSSGMGKSRTVDELAKHHFVIPLNLRGPNSTGSICPSVIHVKFDLLDFYRVSAC
jgi:hypothetical protein